MGEISEEAFGKRFDEMSSSHTGQGVGYHVLVILNGDKKVVGTGALVVERKL